MPLVARRQHSHDAAEKKMASIRLVQLAASRQHSLGAAHVLPWIGLVAFAGRRDPPLARADEYMMASIRLVTFAVCRPQWLVAMGYLCQSVGSPKEDVPDY